MQNIEILWNVWSETGKIFKINVNDLKKSLRRQRVCVFSVRCMAFCFGDLVEDTLF